jgi:hypothetical protein
MSGPVNGSLLGNRCWAQKGRANEMPGKMKPAHYMRFTPGHRGSPDRIGGFPSHLPPSYPVSIHTGRPMSFLAQFYCHPGRLEVDGALCIHLYQGTEDYEPEPLAVAVPLGAQPNETWAGTQKTTIRQHDVVWEIREDPDQAEDWQTDVGFSKAGGSCYFLNTIGPNEKLLLQLTEQPAGLNFGGYTAVVVQIVDGRVEARSG